MPVNVIGTLKPKNNGKFPVAEAVDIKVTDDLRLDKALENKADLSSVNFALAGKANTSDVNTAVLGLQAQVDQIAQTAGTGTADTEIAQARVNNNGLSFETLKKRLDSKDVADSIVRRYIDNNLFIIDDYCYTTGYYYNTEGQKISNTDWGYTEGLIPVEANTTYISSLDTDIFCNYYTSNKEYISSKVGRSFTTPANAAYIRISVSISHSKSLKFTKGKYINYIESAHTELAETTSLIGEYADLTAELTKHYRIATDSDPVDVSSIEYVLDWDCGIFSCVEGDRFRVIGTGGGTYRMWSFIDDDGHILSQADAQSDYNVSKDIKVTAPEGATMLVVNLRVFYISCAVYKYNYNFITKPQYQKNAADVEHKFDMLIYKSKVAFSDAGLTQGYYINKDTGEMVANSDHYASDYVDVSNMDSIILFNVAQSAYYNENKEYMGDFGNIPTTLYVETSFQIPEGAKYIRCSVYKTRVDTAYYKPHSNASPLDDEYSYAFRMSDIENDAGYLKNNTLYIGVNREYTTLRSGIAEAIKTPNTKVYVDPGTYDLTAEFADEILEAGTTQYGIELKNGVHIIFSSGATVTAEYTGGVANVETYFAPFYANKGDSDFTLENLNIITKNTRYCVHDECGGTTGSYTHRYINCKMENDNVSSTVGQAYYPQCIGGGLGTNGYIDIEGCYFKTKRAETKRTTCVSYHNNYYANSKSNINVRDCYFDDYGTFRITHYGSSTDISQAIICNCSLGLAPYIEHEGGASDPENMSLLAYMNEIRNSEVPTV